MAEIFQLTSGPMQVSGDTIQPITSIADVLAYDHLTVVLRVLSVTGATPLSIYLYTSTQSAQDDFGDDPDTPAAGSSFVNVLKGIAGGAVVDAVTGPTTVVLEAGFGSDAARILRTLRWASQGSGTFTIEVVARTI